MSMHFAPQWVKPIKPTGSAITPTTEFSPQQQFPKSATGTSASPFPALGQPRSGSPTTIVPPANPPLSYSRVTHTPASPSIPGDGYFPYHGGDGHGEADPSPFPFRYSRDQILAVWDEEKVKERPIELLTLAESGAVIVSPKVVKPVGLRELSELEKKLLATSVNPPMPTRRPQTHNNTHVDAASPMRRPQVSSKDSGMQSPNTSRAPYGGFGRGEGGVFGGSKFSGALADGGGRQPGSLGGGFGGVAKRTNRREASGDDQLRSSAATTWRSARNASGTFEGVLGFGNAANSNAASSDAAANGKPEDDGGSWSAASGQRKWRAAQSYDKSDSDSVPVEPTSAPEPERRESTPVQQHAPTSQTPQPQDLGIINWYYRDPNGQEQGPFTGNQMHEWYSHSYFKDDLPVRRETETTFHSLADLKTNTGNAVQPFLAVVRPRLPPNLPIPLSLGGNAPGGLPSPSLSDSFHRLNVQGMPPHQQQHAYLPNAPFNSHYQPQFNAAPTYQQQPWNPAPGPQTPTRMNGVYGSIGGQQAYPSYGGAIGTRGPEAFTPSAIGQPLTWGAPNPVAGWPQQIPVPGSAPIPQQMPMDAPAPESYFPVEQIQQPTQHFQAAPEPAAVESVQSVLVAESEQAAPEPEQLEPEQPEPEVSAATEAISEPEEIVEPEPATPEPTVEEPAPAPAPVPEPTKAPAPSAWGKPGKAPSRKSSVTAPSSAAPVSKLPPAPVSLPPKPATVAPAAEPTSPVAAVSPIERAPPKAAPWADKPAAASGPSLREIQEAEARQAEARKLARAEARASASPVPTSSDDHHIGTTRSWGLPTQGTKNIAPPPTSSTPPAPAWGGASDGPKKTLKQIQEEEERRKQKQEAQIRAAQQSTATQKRGYADLTAAHAAPTPAQAAAAAAQGWTTIGASGKVTAAPPKPTVNTVMSKTVVQPASKPSTPVVSVPKPVAAAAKANGSSDDTAPSVEFIRWLKQALNGLTVNVDEFISMLLSFPLEPPNKNETLEIIAEMVYASSSTLDGRHFAHEFVTRRQADARGNASRPVQKIVSLADVVKTQPKVPAADAGFKVVKAKKNRRG